MTIKKIILTWGIASLTLSAMISCDALNNTAKYKNMQAQAEEERRAALRDQYRQEQELAKQRQILIGKNNLKRAHSRLAMLLMTDISGRKGDNLVYELDESSIEFDGDWAIGQVGISWSHREKLILQGTLYVTTYNNQNNQAVFVLTSGNPYGTKRYHKSQSVKEGQFRFTFQ